jgi:hypothetical protein
MPLRRSKRNHVSGKQTATATTNSILIIHTHTVKNVTRLKFVTDRERIFERAPDSQRDLTTGGSDSAYPLVVKI